MITAEFENEITTGHPITDYRFFDTSLLCFSDNIRTVCRTECPMYGHSYSCPPAVGTKEECEERCLGFNSGFIFSTVAEVRDIADLEETLSTKPEHE